MQRSGIRPTQPPAVKEQQMTGMNRVKVAIYVRNAAKIEIKVSELYFVHSECGFLYLIL